MDKRSVLVIYTGGTIGMVKEPENNTLVPFNFENIYEMVPHLSRFELNLDFYCFDPLIDSSNVKPEFWLQMANIVGNNYELYDGFVILHGSDTMAYSASALSFLLENLNKPVVFTGSQLPLAELRTDGRDNLINAIEIAAACEEETPIVPEVCIYFENQLMRGNRTIKFNAEDFDAFLSGNYPLLAEVGIAIKYRRQHIRKPNFKTLKVHQRLDSHVHILKLYPGITREVVAAVLDIPGLKALILETFGSGNAQTDGWFLDLLKQASQKGILLLNVTQCAFGTVHPSRYFTSQSLQQAGVIGGMDMTTEAALTKLMYLFGCNYTFDEIKELIQKPLRGEMGSGN